MTEKEFEQKKKLIEAVGKMSDEQCERFIKIMEAVKAAVAAGWKPTDIKALAESLNDND